MPFRKWLVNRRRFLQLSLFVSTLAGSEACSQNRAHSREIEVLVLGAGIAGLAAARELQANGFKVTLLEGRDRIGGRIYTDRSLGFPLDLGASWIHGITDNPIGTLARQGQISIVPTDFEKIALYDSTGTLLSDAELEESYSLYQDILDRATDLAENSERDLSVADAIQQILARRSLTPEQAQGLQWWLQSEIVIESGTDLENLSSWYASEGENFAGDDYVFPEGYDQIIKKLGENLNVKLQQKVVKIDYKSSGVFITTDRDTFNADAAVVTFPLGVLKSGAIAFSPPLPQAKQVALNHFNMGLLNKVFLKFPEQFWPDDLHGFGYLPQEYPNFSEFLNWAEYSSNSVLIAFTGGNFARSLEQLSETEITERVMRVLRRSFGNNIPNPDRILITRWSQDPFALGSYSQIPVGGNSSDRDILAEPVGDRLFFAGEATSSDYPATTHGAYLSGMRAAQQILRKYPVSG